MLAGLDFGTITSPWSVSVFADFTGAAASAISVLFSFYTASNNLHS